jgi:peptidoglycan/LPS O-acetylase OafA/YrhL
MNRATEWIRPAHVPELDGVRGLAILLVVISHFTIPFRNRVPSSLAAMILSSTWCGVDLFFVLSGFLITGILLDTRKADNFFRSFYARRALRIFPLYYVVLAFWFIAIPLFHRGQPEVIRADLQWWYWAYAQNWLAALRGQAVGYISHFWSLAIEEQFYLVWPLAVWLARRPGRVLAMSVAVATLALAVRIAALRAGAPADFYYEATCSRMDSLAMGAALAAVLRTSRAAIVNRLGKFAAAGGLLILVALAIASDGLRRDEPIMQTVGYSALGVAFTSLLAGVTASRQQRGPLARFFGTAFLRSFGKYSYALYVVHFPLYVGANSIFVRFHVAVNGPGGALAFTVAGLSASYALARLSWWAFESRFLRFKDHFAPRLPDPEQPAIASR